MKNINIRFKLTIWYTLMLMLFLSICFTIFYQFIKKELISQLISDMYKDSAILSDSIDYNEYRSVYEFDLNDSDMDMISGGTIYTLYDSYGRWLNGRRSLWIDEFNFEEDTIRYVSYDDFTWMLLDKAAYYNGNHVGYIRILSPLENIYQVLKNIIQTGIAAIIPCLLLSVLGGLFIARRALSPIKKITAAAVNIAVGDFSQRISISTNDEIGILAETFNNMAMSLENSFIRERQFSSDASHELRTPLTAIIAHSDTALKTDNLNDYRDAMKAINIRSKQMQTLLARLLMLARNYEQLDISEFNLSEFLEDIIEGISFKAAKKSVAIKTELAENIICVADQALFVQMFMNIIENAIKYSKAGGSVTVVLDKNEDYIYIEVRNTGKEIAEEDLPYIFDRFYRSDRARSAGEGFGLGLSIAKRAAELHGGNISVKSSPDETSFFIRLPVK